MASVWRLMVVFMVVAMTAIGRVGAQQQLQDCIQKLLPSLVGCLDAVQSPTTKPSADCCKGVSDVVKNQIKCLCALYNSPSAVASYGLNMTRVLEIPVLCKVPANVSVCKTGGSSPPTTAKSAPSPSPTAATSAPSPSPTTATSAPSPSPTTATSAPSPFPTTAESAPSPSPTTAESAPSASSAGMPPGTSGSDKQKNGALRLTWSLKPLWALGLLWASLVIMP